MRWWQIGTDSILLIISGDEDRVEGRRQRAEKAKQRKMEEDQLRDLEMRFDHVYHVLLVKLINFFISPVLLFIERR